MYMKLVENQGRCCDICGTKDKDERLVKIMFDFEIPMIRMTLCKNCLLSAVNVIDGYYDETKSDVKVN